MARAPSHPGNRVLAESRYLRFLERDGWFFVERPNITGIVTIVAITNARELVFVEQPRTPLGRSTIELPAGLAGDEADTAHEPLAEAARRELREETGFDAATMTFLTECAEAPGVSTEVSTFFLATGLVRVGTGGGVDNERIVVHVVPLDEAPGWLEARRAQGLVIAAKAHAGVLFARDAIARGAAP